MNNRTWEKLDDTRVFYKHPDGFIVIKQKDNKKLIMPFVCPVCNTFMREMNDSDYYRIFECCSHCAMKWAEGINREKWLSGWRPSKDEIKNVVYRRKQPMS